MADLKLGSQIGGNLIWHQGILELNPEDTKISYKTQEIITNIGGQTIVGDLNLTSLNASNNVRSLGTDTSWGSTPNGAFRVDRGNSSGAHWLLTSNKLDGTLRAGFQVLTNDEGRTRYYTNGGSHYYELTNGNISVTASLPTIASHLTRKDYVDSEVSRAMDYTDSKFNTANSSITTLDARVTTLDAQNVKLTGNQSIAGVKTFTSLPAIPVTPTASNHATSKSYVDGLHALTVKSVSVSAPLVSTGGTTPALSITPATRTAVGTMSASDKVKLDDLPADALSRSGGTMSGTITFGASGIVYNYNSTAYKSLWHHGNGNITLSGASGDLYLGYDVPASGFATNRVLLSKTLIWGANSSILVDTDGLIPWSKIKGNEGTQSKSYKLTGSNNFNDLNLSGSYNLYNVSGTGVPPFTYGTLLTIGSATDSLTFVTQIATDKANNYTYTRTRNDGVMDWTSWTRLMDTRGGAFTGELSTNRIRSTNPVAIDASHNAGKALFFGASGEARTILGGAGAIHLRPISYTDANGELKIEAGLISTTSSISSNGLTLNNVDIFNGASNILVSGDNNTGITTAQFITKLTEMGAFNNRHWVNRTQWNYAGNNVITDTGCGNIHLAGCVVEVFGYSSNYTIRITTPSTGSSSLGYTPNSTFVYVNNGSTYSPTWRREYSTANKPTNVDVGLSNYSNTSAAAHGSVSISGQKNGYAGINFADFNRTLMINSTISGVYDSASAGWHWYFNNGVLTEGTVPWARISGAPAYVSKSGDTMTGLLNINGNSTSFKGLDIFNAGNGWSYLAIGSGATESHIAFNNTVAEGAIANSLHLRPVGTVAGSLILQPDTGMIHSTTSGTITIGCLNGAYAHFNTSNPQFYFYKSIVSAGTFLANGGNPVYHTGNKPTSTDVGLGSVIDARQMRDDVGSITTHDWNTLTTSGGATVSNASGVNRPSSYNYGTLLNVGPSSSPHRAQIYFPHNASAASASYEISYLPKFRSSFNSLSSSTWQTLATTEYLHNASISTSDATVSTIVKRDGVGDVNVRLIRSSYPNESSISGGLMFRVNNTTDNYNRVCDNPTSVRNWLGAAANVSTSTVFGGFKHTWDATTKTLNLITT